MVEIFNLVKVYKGSITPALNDLSFQINRNEIFGLLGPNGAGKSTLVSILSCIIQATSGKVLINGKNPQHHLKEIKNIIGVVSQDIALYDKLTAWENLYYFGSLYGIQKKELVNKISELLHRLGLYKNKDITINKFSGGMKRRINLLAGVLNNPELLLLDEPTVGVDVQTRNVIRDFIYELKENGTTILYSSHLMSDIEEICDNIVLIDHGKLVLQGKPVDLLKTAGDKKNLEDLFLDLTGRNLRD